MAIAPQIAITNTPQLYTFTVTNQSDVVAISTVVTQKFGLNGTFQSVLASIGTAQVHGTEIDWAIGDFPGHGLAQISVQLLPIGPQTITNETRVSTPTYDPFPANNLVQIVTPVQGLSTNPLVRVLNLGASDLVYDPSTQLLWANTTNSGGTGLVIPIEPLAGIVGPGIDTLSEVGRLGVAGNGANLYCLQPSVAGLARVDCISGQLDQFTSLGYNPTFGFVNPLDLAIMPGSPSNVAVSYFSTSSSLSNFVALVKNGVLQSDIAKSTSRPNVIEFDSAGDQVYGFNNSSSSFQLSTFGMTASGFVFVTNRSGLVSGFNTDIKRGGSRLYSSIGQVIDPRTGTVITNLPLSLNATAVEPAPGEGRVYYATKLPYAVRALNITNFSATATNAIVAVTSDVRTLVRWGIDGLAMQTAGGQVIIVRSSAIPITNPLYISGFWLQDRNLAVVFPSAYGRTYALEMRTNISGAAGWQTVQNGIVGTGNDLTNYVPMTSTNGFFRVRMQP